MLWLEQGHYVRIEEMAGGPQPLPLKSGFSKGVAYRMVGMFNPSETSEAYMVLVNDRDETWFISNRHLRMCPMEERGGGLRYPLANGATPTLHTEAHGAIYHAAE